MRNTVGTDHSSKSPTPMGRVADRLSGIVIVWFFLAVVCLARATEAQTLPGRFLVSPRQDIVFDCNVDGSNCFHVTGASQPSGDPGGGDQDPSLAYSPSIASNGIIAFLATYAQDGSCSGLNGQGICASHVFLMDADGTNVRQITFNPPYDPQTFFFGGDLNASISPDGSMVAFVSNRNDAYDANGTPWSDYAVYVVNIDGSGLRQVTPFMYDASGNPHGNMYSVAWSPDGRRLAFKGSAYGTECGTFFGSPIEFLAVGTVNVDGTGYGYVACDNVNAAGGATALDWSPDGTLLADARDSVHFGEPAIRIIDLSGRARFAAGLTLAQLGVEAYNSGEACPSDRHCIHFSPDSARIAYENNFPSDNPSFAGISTINLDGTGRVDAIQFGTAYDGYGLSHGLWWAAGPALPTASQITVPPNPVEVWPGFSYQLTPDLLDSQNNLILHTARAYSINYVYFHSCGFEIGPYGLVMFRTIQAGNEGSTVSASNEGLTSNSVSLKCWASPPCTYSISPTTADFSSAGGSGSVFVTSDPGTNNSSCPWTAKSDDPWITITSGAQGSGSAWVSYTVAPDSGSARAGTLTIAGQTLTVNQGAVPPPSTDLSITKTDSPDPATVGTNLTYTITVRNGGPSTATGVAVSDSLPGGVTFVSATSSQGSCSIANATIGCSLGSLSNSASATVRIVVTPTQSGSISNTATVTGNENDPALGNNSATQTTTVNPAPQTLSSLSPALLWIGQGDSVKQLKFDLLTEVLVNGAVVGSGQLMNVSGGSSTFGQALLDTVSLSLSAATAVPAGSTISVRPSVRSSCSVRKAGNSGVARLWYNGQPIDSGKPATHDAGSRFGATMGGASSTYFLRSGFSLATTPGASREFVDVPVSDSFACPARPFTPFGTWSNTLP